MKINFLAPIWDDDNQLSKESFLCLLPLFEHLSKRSSEPGIKDSDMICWVRLRISRKQAKEIYAKIKT